MTVLPYEEGDVEIVRIAYSIIMDPFLSPLHSCFMSKWSYSVFMFYISSSFSSVFVRNDQSVTGGSSNSFENVFDS